MSDTSTIKKIAAAAVKEQTLKQAAQENRMRSRKWLSWVIWLGITVVSLFIVYTKVETLLDINVVLKMFGIITIIYILGNVTEKFVLVLASKLAEIIGHKIERFLDE